jgi:hypothetical protein
MDYAIILTVAYIAIIAFLNAPKSAKPIATESESINYFPEVETTENDPIPDPWETEIEVVITATEVITQPTIAVNAIALLAPATVQCSEPELKEDKLMYSLMTAAKLKQIARKQKVKGYGSMSKRQLIAAIA